jgi:hypothetical protein
MCDEFLFTEGGLNCDHTSHGLSNQRCGAINPRHNRIHHMVEASDGGICWHPSEAWIGDENFLGLKSQLTRQWLPKVPISKSSRKKEYL